MHWRSACNTRPPRAATCHAHRRTHPASRPRNSRGWTCGRAVNPAGRHAARNPFAGPQYSIPGFRRSTRGPRAGLPGRTMTPASPRYGRKGAPACRRSPPRRRECGGPRRPCSPSPQASAGPGTMPATRPATCPGGIFAALLSRQAGGPPFPPPRLPGFRPAALRARPRSRQIRIHRSRHPPFPCFSFLRS